MPLFHDPNYPRPQLRRAAWTSLDGPWDFALDPDARWNTPAAVIWDREIVVPFAPETPASGINELGFFRSCWYRRRVTFPIPEVSERFVLHFGAVDTVATVWVNGLYVCGHDGGYTPFQVEIGDFARTATGVPVEIVVRVEDDPGDLAKPRGKQDWHLEPHGIWYPRTTGIWQTVWWERVPATAITSLIWSSNVAAWEIGLRARVDGVRQDDLRITVQLDVDEADHQSVILASDSYAIVDDEVTRTIGLRDPGIDDARKELLWSPESPTLIQAHVSLVDANGVIVDEVASYTALRMVETQAGRFLINGRPQRLRMVLDQGYWPETGLTAPDSLALRRDIELTKAMGFNGARKHQKIEDPRYLYWADQLGLFVWEELPSAYCFSSEAINRATRLWSAAIERDVSHPCIVAWVPFNESWGVPYLPVNASHRAYVAALYHLTKALDPTRPVVANDGWETGPTDVVGIHDYDENPEQLVRRYHDPMRFDANYWRDHVSGRLLSVEGHIRADQPLMLSEFGGIAYVPAEQTATTWGYTRASTATEFGERYAALLAGVRSLDEIAGFCYTQFADTYQEANGLLFADRTPKVPLEAIALATRGPNSAREIEREHRAEIDALRRTEDHIP